MISSVANSPAPPTSIVTKPGLIHPSILMISSTISLASFLSQDTCPQKPKSWGPISNIESVTLAPVADAEFSTSEESNSPIARISISAK